jgi:hypothetical protein
LLSKRQVVVDGDILNEKSVICFKFFYFISPKKE